MSIVIKEVLDKKDLKAFIEFPYQLYKDHPHFIPPLRFDERATLSRDKNPAFDYCEARYWLAYKNNKVAGRIAAIHNKAFIEKWKSKYLRFGWIDFEDDENIARALVGKVEEWAKEMGMDAVHGPLGFTDLDHEGMLVEGFDQKGTMAAIYNYPYYPFIIEKAGYRKHADWIEQKITVPGEMNDKLQRLASVVQKRLQLQVVRLNKQKDLLPYVPQVFELINSAYADLYGVVPLTEKQVQYYTRQYFSFIRRDFITLIKDKEGKLAAFGITMPSLSDALQKSKGNLFPFGFIHLLKARSRNHAAELLLVAVRKDMQGKGLNALLMNETLRSYIKNGIRIAETNHMLEDNKRVQSFWNHFESVQHKRRRCYIKFLEQS